MSAAHDPEKPEPAFGLRSCAKKEPPRRCHQGMIVKPEDSGGVTDLRTTKAMSSVEAKDALAAAAALAPGFKSAGGT